jgi:lipoate-protein ligase B
MDRLLTDIPATATTVDARWLGRIGYGEAWELQRQTFDAVVRGEAPNTFLLCEHPDVITLGRNCHGDENLRAPRQQLETEGYEIFNVDRGGDVTYHGPGQLVGYPIIRLGDFREDLGWYMRSLEELIIRAIAGYGIEGGRKEGMSGVWVGERKICAIGVRASRWTTMHGFALNVSTDLARFDAIVPCGITSYGVTSILEERGLEPGVQEVAERVAAAWDGVFGAEASRDLPPQGERGE